MVPDLPHHTTDGSPCPARALPGQSGYLRTQSDAKHSRFFLSNLITA